MRERRTCCVANDGCKAPAGYRVGGVGGGVAEGDGSTRATCWRCGNPVCTGRYCSSIVGGRRMCEDCAAEEREDAGPCRRCGHEFHFFGELSCRCRNHPRRPEEA